MNLTDLYDAYLKGKDRNPGKVVLVAEGRFYRTFDLDVVLVERASGMKETDGTLRLPRSLLHATIGHLLRAGEQVAICEAVKET